MSLSKQSGFTLIELLVVMTIISVVMGLVGGVAVNGYTKYKAKAELLTIERLIQRANIQAFATEQPLFLSMEQNSLVLRTAQKEIFSKSFEYTELPTDNIVFNRQGIPSENSVDIMVSGRLRRLSLVSGN